MKTYKQPPTKPDNFSREQSRAAVEKVVSNAEPPNETTIFGYSLDALCKGKFSPEEGVDMVQELALKLREALYFTNRTSEKDKE